MRSRRYKGNEGEGSSYDLSISDLMAALCCVFILFTIGITTSLKEKNMAANNYNETKAEIGTKLTEALKPYKDIVDFDDKRLIIRFSADRAFEQSKADLKREFRNDLDIIFPIIMQTLYNSKKRNEIEEIRIEGFTATDRSDGPEHDNDYGNPYLKYFKKYGEGSDHDYISGFTLSQQRTMNVLSYCMLTNYMNGIPNNQRDNYKEWVRTHVTASGYSFIRPLSKDGIEINVAKQNELTEEEKDLSKNKSRRVEIRIKTNADMVVSNLATNNNDADYEVIVDEN